MNFKRGQTGIGLILLGVVAIIAVIGLVLLFTKASNTQGAVLTDLSIGNTYSANNPFEEMGIAGTYQSPPYTGPSPGMAYPAYAGYPEKAYPVAVQKTGTRTPAFIVKSAEVGRPASLEDLYASTDDLNSIGVWQSDLFNCYVVPETGMSIEPAYGRYWASSSAESRLPVDPRGRLGGAVFCYANTLGAEQQKPNSEQMIRENILQKLVHRKLGTAKYEWSSVMISGTEVPVSWVSQKPFPFRPQ